MATTQQQPYTTPTRQRLNGNICATTHQSTATSVQQYTDQRQQHGNKNHLFASMVISTPFVIIRSAHISINESQTTMTGIAIFFIFVAAMFVQTSAGFGSALIAMAFLIEMLGTEVATPLFALSFSTVSIVITLRYRRELKVKNIWRMLLASIVGVPIGVGVISQWNDDIMLFLYGIFVIAYALYALFSFKAPRVNGARWQWGAGLLAGMISGAYNTSGPVYVIYGDSQRWQPFEFKGNLQALFFVNSMLATSNHFLFGHMTPQVFGYWVYAVPGIIVGVGLGFLMDRFIKPEPFRKVIQVMLLFIGLKLLL